MTLEQRNANVQRIAASSVALELETGIPAELICGQCIIESDWLASASRNNPFQIKASPTATTYQILEIEEELTPKEISGEVRSGRRIVDMGPLEHGRRRVRIQDRYMIFASLEEAFRAYWRMAGSSRQFVTRLQRYHAHRSIPRFLRELSGGDGQPSHFPNQNYLSLFDEVTGQPIVKSALAKARAGNQHQP